MVRELDNKIFSELEYICSKVGRRYLVKFSTSWADSEGGYGYMVLPNITIFEKVTQCAKCGYIANEGKDPSDIDGHRHSWKFQDRIVFIWNGLHNDQPLIESFHKWAAHNNLNSQN